MFETKESVDYFYKLITFQVPDANGLDLVWYAMFAIGGLAIFGGTRYAIQQLKLVPKTRETYLQKDFFLGCSFLIGAGLAAYGMLIFIPAIDMAMGGRALAIVWLVPFIIGLSVLKQWKTRNLITK